jgi:tRNA(Arg) A34 adenosine deaminase TadA
LKNTDPEFASRLLDVIESDIVPLTRDGVAIGNKVFGAAILRKSDLSLVVAGTNFETENPLWHGEMSTLKSYYEMPEDDRPATTDCIFLTTHEPCSLCLSAITWTGFDNFYYFFGYKDTRDAFNIPHDLKILQEVFKVEDGDYKRRNEFWESHDLIALAGEKAEPQITRIKQAYDTLSRTYQDSKADNSIPLS